MAMASSSFPLKDFNHASMTSSSIAADSLDVGCKNLLFEIFCTVQRLESHVQTHHDRLSLIEVSVRAESMTTSTSTRRSGSPDSRERTYQESTLTTPPRSPLGEFEGKIPGMRRKYEFEDNDEPVEFSSDV